ncbi:cupin domain-containing protein [Chryseolinea sp. T2]|uniref:cupin domain-containing protein n=1 Tax=Chryseolinea sp. T2 TaxID=3129255 RepID=UPI0030781C86
MDNLPVTIESLESNGGARTVTKAIFPPGAKSVPHVHTAYEERFKVLQGELTVIKNGIEYVVNTGEYSPTIQKGERHSYINKSRQAVTVDIILQPGHEGCEVSNRLFVALAKQNRLYLFSKTYSLFMVMFYEVTNTIPVGITGVMYSVLKWLYGKKKMEVYKARLMNLV